MTDIYQRTTEIIDWPINRLAGTPKHGPSLDKPQTKLWRAMGSWWGLLARGPETIGPEFAIFELMENGDQLNWRDTGATVAREEQLTADAHFDGTQLWIATRSPAGGLTLQRYLPDASGRLWALADRKGWTLPGVKTPSVTITTGNDGTIWLAYTEHHRPWYVSGRISQFPLLNAPTKVPGSTPTLIDVDLGALVTLDDGVGLFSSDQGADVFYFSIAHNDGTWTTEIAAQGGLIADDHVAIRVFEGRLYVATKTSRDTHPEDAADDSLIVLFVREPNGEWHHHQVCTIDEPVTRPIPLVEPASRKVHVLYTYGPNPGNRSIQMKSASLDDLQFPKGDGEIVLFGQDAQINDVTSSRELLESQFGGVVLASDGANCRYYFRILGAEANS